MKSNVPGRLGAVIQDSVLPAAVIAAVSYLLLAGRILPGAPARTGPLHTLLVALTATGVLAYVTLRRRRRLAREVRRREIAEAETTVLALKLEEALAQLRADPRLLCMCSWCKSIRDPNGEWRRLEGYLEEHLRADFTHGVCPECMRVEYPDLFGRRTE